MLLFIFLCSCSTKANEEEVLTHAALSKPSFDEESLCEYLLSREEDATYSSGFGIHPFNLDGSASDKEVYAIFQDEKIIFLIVHDDTDHYVENAELIRQIGEEEASLIFDTDTGLCYLSQNDLVLFDENGQLSDKEADTLKDMRTRIDKASPLNRINKKIEMKKKEENHGNAVRIVVRFTEGNEDEKAKEFETFCKGKQLYKLQSAPIYVFLIEKTTEKALKKQLQDLNDLDYVQSVELDGQSELIDPVKERG